MSWFRRRASPDVHFWQIVKYSFLCNAPPASRPTKIKPVKQTARSPRGVISAAVDGCSAADTPVNHGRNSLKRPRKRKKKKSLDSRSSLLLEGRERWHFAFHLGKDKLLNKDLKPELFYLWLKLMVINTQTDTVVHASAPWRISPAKNIPFHSERLVPSKFICSLRSWRKISGPSKPNWEQPALSNQ